MQKQHMDETEAEYTLPTLFTVDKRGVKRYWRISSTEDQITTEHGVVGTAKPVFAYRGIQGVSKGTRAETSGAEQAKRVAERDWVSKVTKNGYAPECSAGKKLLAKVRGAMKNTTKAGSRAVRDLPQHKEKALATGNSTAATVEFEVLPMGCEKWEFTPACLKYFDFEAGVYVQPKMDGIRGIARLQPGADGQEDLVLTTRSGKQLVFLATLKACIKDLLLAARPSLGDLVLDGECYAEKLVEGGEEADADKRFNLISGACRPVRGRPSPVEDQICYHVFDVVDADQTQEERMAVLDQLFALDVQIPAAAETGCPRIHRVRTEILRDQELITEMSESFVENEGFEGLILRDKKAMYQIMSSGKGTRSRSVRKIKKFEDEEFEIVDAVVDPGVSKEHFRWVCRLNDAANLTFPAKPTGERAQKLKWWAHRARYIGQQLTVKFQGKYPTGLPRFPIGKGVRTDLD